MFWKFSDKISIIFSTRLDISLLSSGAGSRQKWRAGKLDDVSAMLMDYIDKYTVCMAAYLAVDNEVQAAIDGLENTLYRYILRERYINKKSWRQIAGVVNYHRSSVLRFHRYALDILEIHKEKPED